MSSERRKYRYSLINWLTAEMGVEPCGCKLYPTLRVCLYMHANISVFLLLACAFPCDLRKEQVFQTAVT